VPAIINSTVEALGTGSKSVDATGWGLSVPKIAPVRRSSGQWLELLHASANTTKPAPITTCPDEGSARR